MYYLKFYLMFLVDLGLGVFEYFDFGWYCLELKCNVLYWWFVVFLVYYVYLVVFCVRFYMDLEVLDIGFVISGLGGVNCS